MTPESTQLLDDWHREISAELAAAEAELPPALEELRKAQADVRRIEAACLDLATVVPAIETRVRGDIASPIRARLTEHQRLLDPARGKVARATGQIKAIKERIAELKRAQFQLEQVVLPANTTEAA